MTTTIAVEPFDPKTATPPQRLAVGQLLADSHAYTYPEDPPLIPEKEAMSLSHLGPDEKADQVVVWEEGKAVSRKAIAWGSLSYDLKQNTHAAHARLVVRPQQRRCGIGQAIARELESVARREGRRLITFGTSSKAPAGIAFARALGAQAALPMCQSRLDLHHLPETLLGTWVQRPEKDAYRLHTWQVIPDEYLERAADMLMVMNTAPRGDLEVDDWQVTPEMIRAWDKMLAEAGETRFLMAAENIQTGELDGYTETFWDADRATLVFQGATAVRPRARGLGLGKWLKAAMLYHLQENCPGARWIRTNNAHSNAAMLGINTALGFEPWAEFTEWQVKLAD